MMTVKLLKLAFHNIFEGASIAIQWNLSKATTFGTKILAALDRRYYYAGSNECKRSFRTTESGHNREVVALHRWPLVQVPLYFAIVYLVAQLTYIPSIQLFLDLKLHLLIL